MKKLTLKAIAGCVFVGTAMLASSAMAAPVISNATGSFGNWGGFDWASDGTAAVDTFNPLALNNTFNLTYWASAAQLKNAQGGTAGFSGPGSANAAIASYAYEYTIKLTLNETSTCQVWAGAPSASLCLQAEFAVNFGGFSIYYDTNVNANQVTGAGITDGILLMTGLVTGQPGGGFNILNGGNATLQGLVNYTNSSYITPDLSSTVATSTLQIGSNQTGWTAPSALPGASGGTLPLFSPTQAPVYFQADANQIFAATVPEPGSLALIGLSLTGLALARRRKSV